MGDTHTDTRTDGRYTEMGSGAMIYILVSFIKTGSGIKKLMGGGDTQMNRQDGLLFFQSKESRLKTPYRIS
jgi:hypothetical protein